MNFCELLKQDILQARCTTSRPPNSIKAVKSNYLVTAKNLDRHPLANVYTLWAIKKCHFILDHNSHVSWWILTLLVPRETGMNAVQRSYKIYNFAIIVTPHYLIKLKPLKTPHFEVICHSILLLNSKNKPIS